MTDWVPNEDASAVLMALYAALLGLIEQGAVDEVRLKASLQKILNEMPDEHRNTAFEYYLEKLATYVGGRERPNLFVVPREPH